MMDQAQALRMRIEEYKRRKQKEEVKKIKIVTVASGKGGVGKTNFSVNLAIALREMGSNVLVFDADLGMANVDVIVGVAPRLNLYDVIFNNKELEDIIINGPKGIRIVPGGSGIESLPDLDDEKREAISEKFGRLKDVDILIIDTGAGMSKNVLGFMAIADDIVIVTTPEPTSITDAYSLIKVALKYMPESRMHIVVNRSLSDKEAKLTYQRLAGAIKRFLNANINYLGYITDDVKVKMAVMEQNPFRAAYPDCPASKCVDSIASLLTGSAINSKTNGVKDFFNRIASILKRFD